MIEADRADHSRAKLDHDLIVPITIGDYSPSALTFGTSQVDIMRHHSCGLRRSPAVPCNLSNPYTVLPIILTSPTIKIRSSG